MLMQAVEVIFTSHWALITITYTNSKIHTTVSYQQGLNWMNRLHKSWTWTTLEDGTEQATWSRN